MWFIIINYYLAVFLLVIGALSSLVVRQNHWNMWLGAAHLVLVMNVLHRGLLHAGLLHQWMVWRMCTWRQHWAHYRVCMGSTRRMPLWWTWRRLLVCSWWCPSWGLWVVMVGTSPRCRCIIRCTYRGVWRAWWIRGGSLCR